MLVNTTHARRLSYCVSGMRTFFKRHDLDFKEFVRLGIDESVFLETKDDMAIKLVQEARKWEADQKNRS